MVRSGQRFRAALPRRSRRRLPGLGRRHGPARLEPPGDPGSVPLQLVKKADGSVARHVVGYIPNVDQSFGGLFKPSSPPPGRTQPACKKLKTPWQGKIKVVKNGVDHERASSSKRLTEAPLDRPEAPSRPSACGGSAGASAACTPSRTSISTSRRRAPRDSRPERGRQDDALQRHRRRLAATLGPDRALRPRRDGRSRRASGRGSASPARTSSRRLFLGLTVEDSIYLAALGVRRRSPSPGDHPARRRDAGAGAGGGRRVAIDDKLGELRRERSRTASIGRSRVAMALASEPRMLMLDEPASGSRAASASC